MNVLHNLKPIDRSSRLMNKNRTSGDCPAQGVGNHSLRCVLCHERGVLKAQPRKRSTLKNNENDFSAPPAWLQSEPKALRCSTPRSSERQPDGRRSRVQTLHLHWSLEPRPGAALRRVNLHTDELATAAGASRKFFKMATLVLSPDDSAFTVHGGSIW